MATYEFRCMHIPGVVWREDKAGQTRYEIGHNSLAAADWGGVMDRTVAAALKPWARPVKLGFDAYRVGRDGWQDLNKGEWLWGTLLLGPGRGQAVVFALLDCGWPMVGGRKKIIDAARPAV